MKYKYNNQWKDLNVKVSDTLPIGTINPYGGEGAPANWLICDGGAVSRTTYADLFSVIGTSFGAGDGSTTFNLPDLRSKVPLGKDSRDEDFDTIGETYGEKKHTLTTNEMPTHKHTVTINRGSGDQSWGGLIGYNQVDGVTYGTTNTSEVGSSQAHNIVQPSLVTNYIIKAFQSAGVVANVAQEYTESNIDVYNCNYINAIDNKFDYSEEEQIVGKWGDKPLYRKVFETTTSIPGGGGFTSIAIPHNIENVDKIWVDNTVSRIEQITSYMSYTLPLVGYEGNNSDIIYTKVDKEKIYIFGEGWGTSWNKVIGILYTKTTDNV